MDDNMLGGAGNIEVSTGEDKTSENENVLDGIPEEDDLGIGGDDKKPEEKPAEKINRSEVAQKIKYREKFLKSQEQIRRLEDRIALMDKRNQSTETEEKELAAQKYIREQARREYEAIKAEQEAMEEQELENFQERIDLVLEENPDVTEDQLLDTCEEYEVEPHIAAKILLKQSDKAKTKKPSLPRPKAGDVEVQTAVKESPTRMSPKKTIYDLAQEIKSGLKKVL